ncbi:MAG TPA: histidine phosphatase family protein, partial [SAR324 cluster bacterium]|nr:histidine phosphatase family protein [SAR324 cluster bacterium]
MELFLIRHAESRNNIRKSDQERVSDPELTDNGRLQSIHLAEFLQKGLHLSRAEYEKHKKPLDQIYCSAMKRSLDTVNPVGVAIGLNPEVWLDIHEVGGIYEFNSDLTKKIGRSGLNRKQIQH